MLGWCLSKSCSCAIIFEPICPLLLWVANSLEFRQRVGMWLWASVNGCIIGDAMSGLCDAAAGRMHAQTGDAWVCGGSLGVCCLAGHHGSLVVLVVGLRQMRASCIERAQREFAAVLLAVTAQ